MIPGRFQAWVSGERHWGTCQGWHLTTPTPHLLQGPQSQSDMSPEITGRVPETPQGSPKGTGAREGRNCKPEEHSYGLLALGPPSNLQLFRGNWPLTSALI